MNNRPWRISAGLVLVEDILQNGDLYLSVGKIVDDQAGGARTFDARGLLVLPGIVDIHGDAHERQNQPRPGVSVPAPLALRDTHAQLLAAGITTAFLGLTCSWEPGLRSIEAWRSTLAAREAAASGGVDLLIHCRFEVDNIDAVDEVIQDIFAHRVHLLAFNDHTPSILKNAQDEMKIAVYAKRARLEPQKFVELAKRAWARRSEISTAITRLAASARATGVPMLRA